MKYYIKIGNQLVQLEKLTENKNETALVVLTITAGAALMLLPWLLILMN